MADEHPVTRYQPHWGKEFDQLEMQIRQLQEQTREFNALVLKRKNQGKEFDTLVAEHLKKKEELVSGNDHVVRSVRSKQEGIVSGNDHVVRSVRSKQEGIVSGNDHVVKGVRSNLLLYK